MSPTKEHKDSSIRALKVKKSGLESEKHLREHEADLLVSYAKTLHGEHVQPDQASTFLDGFVDRGKKNLLAVATTSLILYPKLINAYQVTALTEQIIAIERSIQQETDKALAEKGDTRAHVTIVLATDVPQKVVLKLTYRAFSLPIFLPLSYMFPSRFRCPLEPNI